MSDEPPKEPYDWDQELDERFVDQLFVLVTAAFVAMFLVLLAMLLFNGCVEDIEPPPPTLPAYAMTTTTVRTNHITVATTTSTSTTVLTGDTQP
jgi:hypothetical protein